MITRPKVCPQPRRTTADRRRWEWAAVAEVRRLRIAIGSREKVALLIGVSDDSLGCWERAEKRVPAWALVALREIVAQAHKLGLRRAA